MRTLGLLILITLFSTGALAENSKTDSLTRVLSRSKEDTSKVYILIALSKHLATEDHEQALQYAEQAKTLSANLNFQKGKALSYKQAGLIYFNQSMWIPAINNWEYSYAVFDSTGDKNGVANMLSNLGVIYYNQADDEKALDYYLKALRVAEEIKDTLRIATVMTNIGAIYGKKRITYDKAIDYDLKALALSEILQDNDAIGTITANLGEIYFLQKDYSTAKKYLNKSHAAVEGTEIEPIPLNYLGRVYRAEQNFMAAIEYHTKAFQIAKKLDSQMDMAESLMYLAKAHQEKGDVKQAIATYLLAKNIANSIRANEDLKFIYEGLSEAYAEASDFKNAFKYQNLLIGIKDTLYNLETDKKLGTLQFTYSLDKQQKEINLLTKDKELQELNLQKQKQAKRAFMGGMFSIVLITVILFRNYKAKVKTNKILDSQKNEIEGLLLNILPQEVANELQRTGASQPRYYESVSVLFTDFKGFTTISEGMSPNELVKELNEFFVAFDEIIVRNNLEKIKTIGDAYMCAGGIPSKNNTHPIDIVTAAIEICDFMQEHSKARAAKGLKTWELRVGIHTGPIVAGVVGKKKYAYDIWGSTVNIASRMESNGEPGRINVSAATYNMIKDVYPCVHRGKIYAKNVGEIDMYFVERNGSAEADTKVLESLIPQET